MLTVDFDRLGLRPGERVLDMGCGAGRHAFEMYKRGADVVAFDQDADELAKVREWFIAMREAGEVPEGAEADVKEGDALALPFGRTPISSDERPTLANPCNVLGRLKDFSPLKKVKAGDRVRVEKA